MTVDEYWAYLKHSGGITKRWRLTAATYLCEDADGQTCVVTAPETIDFNERATVAERIIKSRSLPG